MTEAEILLHELLDAYVDACWQGTGNEPLSSPSWHNFLSTYEDADELIPRVRAFCAAMTDPDCTPLDVSGVAERMGVKVDTVWKWRYRQVMPGEDGLVSGQPWWWPETLRVWAAQTGRTYTGP